MPAETSRANAQRANAAHMRKAAIRAVDDPLALARAARIIRVALERKMITVAELTDEPADQAAS